MSGEIPKKYPTKDYLKCYWKFIRPYIKRQITSFIFTIFSTLLGLTSPLLMGLLIDHALTDRDMRMVYIILIISLSVLVFESCFMALQDYLMGYIRSRLSYDLRMALFKRVVQRDIFFFQKKNVGELMSRIISEVRDVLSLFSSTLLLIITQSITLFGTIGVMFYLNWRLAVIAVTAIPLVVISMRYFNPRLRKGNRQIMENYAQTSTVLQENLAGISTLKNFRKEGFGIWRFSKILHKLINAQMRMVFVRILNSQVLSYIYAIAPAALIAFGGKMVIDGAMTVGAFVSFYGYLGKLYQPVRTLSNINIELQQTLVAFYRYYDLLHSFAEESDGNERLLLPQVTDQIKLTGVTFSYDLEQKNLLEDFSISLKPGQMVGIVGRNGIGKSTLFGLLTGIFQPLSGSVSLDGQPVNQLKRGSLQSLYGVVPQDTYLFNMSLYDNILLGRRQLSLEKIDQLAKMLNISDFIRSLPQGFETIAEKNGENFSGGQKQKIGIIRALVHDPQIILLDEATSAIDVETEDTFFQWLAANKAEKIILFISHKPHLLQYADRVIRFTETDQIIVEEACELIS